MLIILIKWVVVSANAALRTLSGLKGILAANAVHPLNWPVPPFCLQDRFDTLRVAVWTKLMLRLAGLCVGLQHVKENTRVEALQFIVLPLSIPCFQLRHFAFKLAYLLNQRRLLRLSGQDFFLKVYDSGISNGSV